MLAVFGPPLLYSDAWTGGHSIFKYLALCVGSGAALIAVGIAAAREEDAASWSLHLADWAILAYAGWVAISTMLAPEPLLSVTGSRPFWDGLGSAFAAAACWTAVRFVYPRNPKGTERSLAVLAALTLLTLLLVAALIVVVPGFGGSMTRNGRLGSLMGQPTFLAGFAVTWLPLLLALTSPAIGVIRTRIPGLPRWRRPSAFAIVAGLASAVVLLIATGSRSGVAAAAVGVALYTGLSGWNTPRRTRRLLLAVALFIPILFAAFLLREAPGESSLLDVFTEGTGASRVAAWETAVDASLEKPFIGNGPGTFVYLHCRGTTPESYLVEPDTVFLDPHNWYLNAAATSGPLAGLAALGIALLALRQAWIHRGRSGVLLGAACGASAYFAHSIFTPNSIATFAGALVLLAASCRDPGSEPAGMSTARPRPSRARSAVGLAIVLTLGVLLMVQGVRVTAAELCYARGWEQGAVEPLTTATRIAPEVSTYQLAEAQVLASTTGGYLAAFERLEAAVSDLPRDPQLAATAGAIVIRAVNADTEIGSEERSRAEDTAIGWIADAVEACPTNPAMRARYARALIATGRRSEASQQLDILEEWLSSDHALVESLLSALGDTP